MQRESWPNYLAIRRPPSISPTCLDRLLQRLELIERGYTMANERAALHDRFLGWPVDAHPVVEARRPAPQRLRWKIVLF